MSVILRLQNLPWTANAMDIRRFFMGLQIPDGGVHIVGGENGDAFIAFSTDEDARKAMQLTSAKLNDQSVSLMLSSKNEMQNVIAIARSAPATGGGRGIEPPPSVSTYERRGPPLAGPPVPGYERGPPQVAGGPVPGQSHFPPGYGPPPSYGPPSRDHPPGPPPRDTHIGGQPPRDHLGGPRMEDNRERGPPPIQNLQRQGAPGMYGPGPDGRGPAPQGHSSSGPPFPGMETRDIFSRPGPGIPGQTGPRGPPPGSMPPSSRPGLIPGGQHVSRGMPGAPPNDHKPSGDNRAAPPHQSGPPGHWNRSAGPGPGGPGRYPGRGNSPPPQYRGRPPHNPPVPESRPPYGGSREDGAPPGYNQRDTAPPRSGTPGGPLRDRDSRPMYGRDPQGPLNFDKPNGPSRDGPMGTEFQMSGSRERPPHDPPREGPRPGVPPRMGLDQRNTYPQDGGPGLHERPGRHSPGKYDDRPRDNSGQRDRGHDRDFDYRDNGSPPRNRDEFSKDDYHREAYSGRDRGRERDRQGGSRHSFIYISNMPNTVNFKEVRRFFSGCEIPRSGLKLINDRHGVRIGCAYVMFARERDAREGLKLNGQCMLDRKVRIDRCTERDFEEAIDSYIPGMEDYKREESPRGRHRSPVERRDRFESPPPKRMRGTSPSPRGRSPGRNTKWTPDRIRDVYRDHDKDGEVEYKPTIDENCIVIKNLPVKIERKDVWRFFRPLRVSKKGIYIEYDRDGRALGIGYVEFAANRDFREALKYHRRVILGHAVDIYPISQEDMRERVAHHRDSQKHMAKLKEMSDTDSNWSDDSMEVLSIEGQEKGGEDRRVEIDRQHDPHGGDKPSGDGHRRVKCVRINGLPFHGTFKMVQDFFRGCKIAWRGIHIIYRQDTRQASGVAFTEFVTIEDCEHACQRDMQYIGRRYISVTPISKENMMAELEKNEAIQIGTHKPGMGNPPGPAEGDESMQVPPNLPDGACLVGGRNLPFTVSESEVIDFFKDFDPIPGSFRKFTYQDKPSGKACIGFQDSETADRAVKALHLHTIRGRPITLYCM